MSDRIIKQDVKIDLHLHEVNGPRDTLYRLMHAADVLHETHVLAAAEIEYDEQRERLWAERPGLSPMERRKREAAHYDLQAVRSDAFERRAKAARPKGGRGGRGGV